MAAPDTKRALLNYLEFLQSSGFAYVETDAATSETAAQHSMPQPPAKTQIHESQLSSKMAPKKNLPPSSIMPSPGAVTSPPASSQPVPVPHAVPAVSIANTPSLPIPERVARLAELATVAAQCRACTLGSQRDKLVFSDGPPDAKIVFVGEAPGADENASGIPFVGRGGQLLNKMIEAIGFKREEVYICNTVKCRPPANRDPLPKEKTACEHFLVEQLAILRPQILVALGAHSAQYLCRSEQSIGKLRGTWRDYHGVALYVTYHPAFLLRSPGQKSEAWKDFQEIHRKYTELNPTDLRKLWAK